MTMRVVLALLYALAMQTQTPPRDARPAAPAADAVPATITGRVLLTATKGPGRNVVVLLRPVNRSTQPAPAATTDIDGRFTVSNVPPGAYTVSVSKPAYLTASYRLAVKPGQMLDAGEFELRKGGVIAGRVVDEFGDPVQFASVGARRDRPEDALGTTRVDIFAGAQSTMRIAGGRETGPASTDDRGQFRLYGVDPGTYIVAARLTVVQGIVDNALLSNVAPTYYPGTVWLNDARTVKVGSEQEVSGVDIVMQTVRLVRVTGVVTDSTGAPLDHGSLSLELNHRSSYLAKPHDVGLDAQGRFQLAGVDPGEYLGTVVGRTRESVSDPPEAAMFFVKVTGEPIGDVAITTGPPVTAFGTARFEGGSAPGEAVLVAHGTMGRVLKTTRFEWKDEGSFQLRGLYGRLLLRWSNVPPGWTVKEMRLAGRDVTSEALDFVPGTAPVGPLEVVFTKR